MEERKETLENIHPTELRWNIIERDGEILEYYDGPQLYLLYDRFLVLKVGLPSKWIILDPVKEELEDFLKGRICLKTLMLLELHGWLIDESIENFVPIETTYTNKEEDEILLPDFGFYATGETSLGLQI